jgi:Protein of unknown function DUF262
MEHDMTKRSPTTKDVGLLYQLYQDGQLKLASEFQRNSVWPRPAKAYLIDTILNDRPIPILFFQRSASPQSGRSVFTVIDGQQRLRAIFEFLDGRFRLSESKEQQFYRKRFADLSSNLQNQIRNYDLVVEELSGYSDRDIRDMFVRMNKYVVKLSRQELRHARGEGAFKDFVEEVGQWDFWVENKVFSAFQISRMRSVEFAAELAILLVEGPQDKKSAVDLYYGQYQRRFPAGKAVSIRLKAHLKLIKRLIPDLSNSRFRRPVDLYSLIGALDLMAKKEGRPPRIDIRAASKKLAKLAEQLGSRELAGDTAQYAIAASRQTDNIAPRTKRMEILASILREA